MSKEEKEGVWRTVGGRKIFIKYGENLSSAMKRSGKFKIQKKEKDINKKTNDNEEKIKKLEEELEETKGFLARAKIKEEIESLKAGYDNVEDYRKAEKERKEKISAEREQERQKKEEARIKKYEELKKEREQEIKEVTSEKKEQFEIIQETNPMLDELHVGIRSPKDIKTWEEVLKMDDDEHFSWGDFSKEDAEKALKKGTITIYSSYPIEQGNFVSTSKIQAEEYAGGKGSKIYTKEVPLNEVAWINGDEGQYAKISSSNSNGSKFANMSRQQLATLLVEDQIKRGVVKPENKQKQIQARLTGGAKMSKSELFEYAKKYL